MDFEDIMPSEMSYKEKQISYNLTYTWNLEKKAKQRNNLELINTENRSRVSRGRESEKAWQPTPVLLPGKSHGQRSLVGSSPGVARCRTRLSYFTFTFYFHALEKEMATHSSVLAWRIPGTG